MTMVNGILFSAHSPPFDEAFQTSFSSCENFLCLHVRAHLRLQWQVTSVHIFSVSIYIKLNGMHFCRVYGWELGWMTIPYTQSKDIGYRPRNSYLEFGIIVASIHRDHRWKTTTAQSVFLVWIFGTLLTISRTQLEVHLLVPPGHHMPKRKTAPQLHELWLFSGGKSTWALA